MAPTLFLSYARSDDDGVSDQSVVRRIYQRLKEAGYDVWWDRERMPNRALAFLQEIRDAVEKCDRLVLIVGPGAVSSEYVKYEWRHALAYCKPVYPVLLSGDYELLPSELSKLDTPDFRDKAQFERSIDHLFRHLSSPPVPLGALFGVPTLPPNYLVRQEALDSVAKHVFAEIERPVLITSVERTTALEGMGGIGKSVLATAFVHLCETRRVFTDGIIWITVGQEIEDINYRLMNVGSALSDPAEHYKDVRSSQQRLNELLCEKSCLIVLDDVWRVEHAEVFQSALGPRCRLLITSREGTLATTLGAIEYQLNLLTKDESLHLLSEWTQIRELPPVATDVAVECGYLPFAIALCGAMIRDGVGWNDLLQALRDADLTFLEKRLAGYPYPSILRAIKASVDALANEEPNYVQRYLELAIFPKDELIPEMTIVALWMRRQKISERNGRILLSKLARKSLLKIEGEEADRHILLHDLQYDYLRAALENIAGIHNELLAAYEEKSGADLSPEKLYQAE